MGSLPKGLTPLIPYKPTMSNPQNVQFAIAPIDVAIVPANNPVDNAVDADGDAGAVDGGAPAVAPGRQRPGAQRARAADRPRRGAQHDRDQPHEEQPARAAGRQAAAQAQRAR